MAYHNSQRFIQYYTSQAGHGLPGFAGSPVMYGRGLGSMLSRAFRFVLPFLKRGVDIAKPHLKTAAKGIASDLASSVVSGRFTNTVDPRQEGSGLLLLSQRRRKRPPAPLHRPGHKKPRRAVRIPKSRAPKRKRKSLGDIF